MADPSQTTEAIRTVLGVGGRAAEEALAELASNYSRFCRELNQRLRRCDEYAKRQLFSELLYLSQCPTDVHSAVELALSVDHTGWANLCAARGLELPPQLQKDLWPSIAVALEQARQIEPLIARYRLTVLAGSPAIERLRPLRVIASVLPESNGWTDELRKVEETRLGEIRELAKQSITKNGDRLTSLLQEVESSQWRTSTCENVLNFLRQADLTRRKGIAAIDMQLLLPQLESSYRAKDFQACDKLLVQSQLLLETGIDVNPEITEKIKLIESWADEKRRLLASTQKVAAIQPILNLESDVMGRWKRYRAIIAAMVGALLIVIAAAAYRRFGGRG